MKAFIAIAALAFLAAANASDSGVVIATNFADCGAFYAWAAEGGDDKPNTQIQLEDYARGWMTAGIYVLWAESYTDGKEPLEFYQAKTYMDSLNENANRRLAAMLEHDDAEKRLEEQLALCTALAPAQVEAITQLRAIAYSNLPN